MPPKPSALATAVLAPTSVARRSTAPDRSRRRVVRGDWQTPLGLAHAVVETLRDTCTAPGSVLEPTCGRGSFLEAAAHAFPTAHLRGYDIERSHIDAARRLPALATAELRVADFFSVDWRAVVSELPEPVLVLGNPPWVTSAALGRLEGTNLPPKTNDRRSRGLEARTGASNFDISEWMIVRLLEAAAGRSFVLAMLCKASVARRAMERASPARWSITGEVRAIDARAHFAAAVDAVLLTVRGRSLGDEVPDNGEPSPWPVFASLDAGAPHQRMGVVAGQAVAHLDAYVATRHLAHSPAARSVVASPHLALPAEIEWRSGLKHDCARVMELDATGSELVNGIGEVVRIEPDRVYPLLKGSDLAHGRAPSRAVVVTQTRLGDDTAILRTEAPRAWAYLLRHRASLDARKSSIYRGRPPFSIFGIGDYAFAPYKVAVSGLHKRLCFRVVEPIDGRPVMLDDTCYFLPCSSRAEAESLHAALSCPDAARFFEARVFWDAKRPIHKRLLQSLSLAALLRPTSEPR
jgi:hypothetical protein